PAARSVDQTAAARSRAEKRLKPKSQSLLPEDERVPQAVHETSYRSLDEAPGPLPGSHNRRPTIVSPPQAAGTLKRSSFISARGPAITPSRAVETFGDTRPLSMRSEKEHADALSSSVPAIRVTIGRVEVRAILAPSTAPRTAPAGSGSAPSLKSYLKRRGGE